MFRKMRIPTVGETKPYIIALALVLLLTGCGMEHSCECDAEGFDLNLFNFSRHVQGSGNMIRKVRAIDDVSTVVLSEEGDLTINMGDKEQLIIEAEDNLQEYLIADVEAGVLDIKKYPHKIILEPTKPIRYHLTLKELKSLRVKNSGDVDISEVKTDFLRISVTGSGNVRIGSVDLRQLDLELNSSASLTIGQGEVETQNIMISSSGVYESIKVNSLQADLGLSSSGNAWINVNDKLTVSLSSSGNVYYLGDPDLAKYESSSTGRLIKMH